MLWLLIAKLESGGEDAHVGVSAVPRERARIDNGDAFDYRVSMCTCTEGAAHIPHLRKSHKYIRQRCVALRELLNSRHFHPLIPSLAFIAPQIFALFLTAPPDAPMAAEKPHDIETAPDPDEDDLDDLDGLLSSSRSLIMTCTYCRTI